MGDRLFIIVQFNPSYFAFLSGITVSTATNLLTNLATDKSKWYVNLPSLEGAILFLASGVAFILLSWNLEEPFSKWKSIKESKTKGKDLDWTETEIRQVALSGKVYILWGLMVIGILLSALGFVILLV